MHRTSRRTNPLVAFLAAGLAGLATLTFASSALAMDPPRTAHVIQFGGGFRYGLSLDDPTPDPWGAGLGLELGYTTGDAIYFGTVFDYFFGESAQIAGADLSANLWQIAAEGGYDFQLSEAVLVRPKLGLGAATVMVDCSNCTAGVDPSASETKFAAAPGLTAMFFVGNVILSVDTRFQMVFAEETMKALVFSFGIGF